MKKIKSIHNKVQLSDCPIVLKDKVKEEINNKLVDNKTGNYLIQIESISDLYKTWIDYEYHCDVNVIITDINDKSRMEGVTVPGMGPKPISLNSKYKLHTSSFFTWELFEDQLLNKCLKAQKCINEEGYYAKEKK